MKLSQIKALVTAAPVLLTFSMLASSAQAAGDYGQDTCASGYVWREAIPSDHVCVTPQVRQQTAYDNFKGGQPPQPHRGLRLQHLRQRLRLARSVQRRRGLRRAVGAPAGQS